MPPQPSAFLLVLTANGTEVALLADTVSQVRRAEDDLAPPQVNQLHTFGLNEVVLSGAEDASSAYSGGPATIRANIEQIDKQWSTAEDSSVLVQQRLNKQRGLLESSEQRLGYHGF
jgi:hypothetical protein